MKEFIEAPRKIYEAAKAEGRLIFGASTSELKKLALRGTGVVLTQMGSIAVDSEPQSRVASDTKNSKDHIFGEDESRLAAQAIDILGKTTLISVDAQVGEKTKSITARVIVPIEHAHLAYFTGMLFGLEPKAVENPTYWIVVFTDEMFEKNKMIQDVRLKDITISLYLGEKRGEQVKIVRNSNYFGEIKKGVFADEDWRAKSIDKEGLFLHAGARRDHLWVFNHETSRPKLKTITTLVSGLTATGKTTTLCRTLVREWGEISKMVGDDGGTIHFNGSFWIFEPRGLYVKTENLELGNQPEIFRAALSHDVCLENVALTKYPYVPDFSDISRAANARAVVSRKNLEIATRELSVDGVDNLILLTRNPLVNAISRLTTEQAVMQLIYGESQESSGGNPVEAGNFTRVFFLDPFMAGDKLEHAMILYEILKKNPRIKCYLSNTGTIGENEVKVTLRDSLAIYEDILRDKMKFSITPDGLGYYYPVKSDRANSDLLRAEPKFGKEAYQKRVKDFLKGRQAIIEELEKGGSRLPENIKNSLKYK